MQPYRRTITKYINSVLGEEVGEGYNKLHRRFLKSVEVSKNKIQAEDKWSDFRKAYLLYALGVACLCALEQKKKGSKKTLLSILDLMLFASEESQKILAENQHVLQT